MVQLTPVPAGKLSVTLSPVAIVSLLLVKVTEKPICEPALTLAVSAVLVMETAAGDVGVGVGVGGGVGTGVSVVLGVGVGVSVGLAVAVDVSVGAGVGVGVSVGVGVGVGVAGGPPCNHGITTFCPTFGGMELSKAQYWKACSF
jgi:hypothetical protein